MTVFKIGRPVAGYFVAWVPDATGDDADDNTLVHEIACHLFVQDGEIVGLDIGGIRLLAQIKDFEGALAQAKEAG